MTSPNVELARQAYEAMNRRDVDWLIERAHPDFEMHMRSDVENPTGSVYTLRDGLVTEIRTYRTLDEARAAAGVG